MPPAPVVTAPSYVSITLELGDISVLTANLRAALAQAVVTAVGQPSVSASDILITQTDAPVSATLELSCDAATAAALLPRLPAALATDLGLVNASRVLLTAPNTGRRSRKLQAPSVTPSLALRLTGFGSNSYAASNAAALLKYQLQARNNGTALFRADGPLAVVNATVAAGPDLAVVVLVQAAAQSNSAASLLLGALGSPSFPASLQGVLVAGRVPVGYVATVQPAAATLAPAPPEPPAHLQATTLLVAVGIAATALSMLSLFAVSVAFFRRRRQARQARLNRPRGVDTASGSDGGTGGGGLEMALLRPPQVPVAVFNVGCEQPLLAFRTFEPPAAEPAEEGAVTTAPPGSSRLAPASAQRYALFQGTDQGTDA